jgi:hypothetical protein
VKVRIENHAMNSVLLPPLTPSTSPTVLSPPPATKRPQYSVRRDSIQISQFWRRGFDFLGPRLYLDSTPDYRCT